MKILVVDDDLGTVNAIRAGLTSVGYQIIPAASGHEALKILESPGNSNDEPSLLLTDFRMPEMNGLDLIQRAKKVRPTLPAILMTAYGHEHLREEVNRLGDCGYVEKPFSLGKLVDIIQDLIDY